MVVFSHPRRIKQDDQGMKMDQVDSPRSTRTPKIFVICDQPDTAPVWGYILGKGGLDVVLEKSIEKALDHWSTEIPDLTVIDLDASHRDSVEFCKTIRAVSATPILLLLPAYDELRVLDAYHSGMDDVIIKPISPVVFLAKIEAWLKRSWTIPVESLSLVLAGRYRLDASKRCLIDREEKESRLTSLEFRLLHLLMSRPGEIVDAEDLIQSIWGPYGSGDHILLKNVVYRLRRKIEIDPSHPVIVQTWPGGYLFQG